MKYMSLLYKSILLSSENGKLFFFSTLFLLVSLTHLVCVCVCICDKHAKCRYSPSFYPFSLSHLHAMLLNFPKIHLELQVYSLAYRRNHSHTHAHTLLQRIVIIINNQPLEYNKYMLGVGSFSLRCCCYLNKPHAFMSVLSSSHRIDKIFSFYFILCSFFFLKRGNAFHFPH